MLITFESTSCGIFSITLYDRAFASKAFYIYVTMVQSKCQIPSTRQKKETGTSSGFPFFYPALFAILEILSISF